MDIRNIAIRDDISELAIYRGEAFGRIVQVLAPTDAAARLWSLMHVGGIDMHRVMDAGHFDLAEDETSGSVRQAEHRANHDCTWECDLVSY